MGRPLAVLLLVILTAGCGAPEKPKPKTFGQTIGYGIDQTVGGVQDFIKSLNTKNKS